MRISDKLPYCILQAFSHVVHWGEFKKEMKGLLSKVPEDFPVIWNFSSFKNMEAKISEKMIFQNIKIR